MKTENKTEDFGLDLANRYYKSAEVLRQGIGEQFLQYKTIRRRGC